MLALVLSLLFGHPSAVFRARIAAAMATLCPCRDNLVCEAQHARAATVIATVAEEDADPEDAAALLLGTGAHETRFEVVLQARGGPGRGWWQATVAERDREAILADPAVGARWALRAARGCRGGSLRAFAWGGCEVGSEAQERTAAELRAAVVRARWALR